MQCLGLGTRNHGADGRPGYQYLMIDNTIVRAHLQAASGKGG